MQLGKALVGAIIGAAVGIGLLLGAYSQFGWDKFWLAIPFAFITGMGVRMLVSTSGHASYARGVLTMILAMAAYFAGLTLVAQVATAKANKPPEKKEIKVEEAPADATDPDAPKEEAPPTPPPVINAPRMDAGKAHAAAPSPGSPWDVIWLAIAALVAYELGRGSGTAAATAPAGPLPAGTHPDA
jgi:hypothetical protein